MNNLILKVLFFSAYLAFNLTHHVSCLFTNDLIPVRSRYQFVLYRDDESKPRICKIRLPSSSSSDIVEEDENLPHTDDVQLLLEENVPLINEYGNQFSPEVLESSLYAENNEQPSRAASSGHNLFSWFHIPALRSNNQPGPGEAAMPPTTARPPSGYTNLALPSDQSKQNPFSWFQSSSNKSSGYNDQTMTKNHTSQNPFPWFQFPLFPNENTLPAPQVPPQLFQNKNPFNFGNPMFPGFNNAQQNFNGFPTNGLNNLPVASFWNSLTTPGVLSNPASQTNNLFSAQGKNPFGSSSGSSFPLFQSSGSYTSPFNAQPFKNLDEATQITGEAPAQAGGNPFNFWGSTQSGNSGNRAQNPFESSENYGQPESGGLVLPKTNMEKTQLPWNSGFSLQNENPASSPGTNQLLPGNGAGSLPQIQPAPTNYGLEGRGNQHTAQPVEISSPVAVGRNGPSTGNGGYSLNGYQQGYQSHSSNYEHSLHAPSGSNVYPNPAL